MPDLELVNAKFNSLYQDDKIYVSFNGDSIYIGSTSCESLKIRFKWHLTNKSSQMFKHKQYNPSIELIVLAPSNDKKGLKKIENGYIHEYAEKYGNKLLNKRCDPNLKSKKIDYKVVIENEEQLRKRIESLDKKMKKKDN